VPKTDSLVYIVSYV